jgi:hypothetical protein
MAREKLCGRTAEELIDFRAEYEDLKTEYKQFSKPFDEHYCLASITTQPSEYDGPDRYCCQPALKDRDYCNYHKKYENLSPTANMTHGLNALRNHLVDDFSEDEQEAYEDIVEMWGDYYDIEDPSSMDTLQSMAVEIVREVRADVVAQEHRDAAQYTDDGLTRLKEEFGPEGETVGYDQVPNHIVDIRQSTRRLIEKLKRNLGITRKHQDKMNAEEDKSSTIEALSESVADSLDGGEYDPDEFEE